MPSFGPNPVPDPAQPMIDWIIAAPPAELAPELMEAFSPEAPRRVPWIGSSEFEEWMFRAYPKRTGLILAARPVQEPILEAIQLLEHAELVFVRFISTTDGGRSWSATRLGLATLAEGKAAVRQRIKDRTSL
jgi:hypothetical protein